MNHEFEKNDRTSRAKLEIRSSSKKKQSRRSSHSFSTLIHDSCNRIYRVNERQNQTTTFNHRLFKQHDYVIRRVQRQKKIRAKKKIA